MSGISASNRWRLVLGPEADPGGSAQLETVERDLDRVLSTLYNNGNKKGIRGSRPKVNRWLGDIRAYFPQTVVRMMQLDAMERLGLKEMLVEPELLDSLEPDVSLGSCHTFTQGIIT